MRSFFTDTVTFTEIREQDVLPAHPSRMAFLWTRTSKLTEVWDIVRATRLWPEVVILADASGLCFSVTGHSLGHLDWEGRLDLPFSPKVLHEATGSEAVNRHSNRAVFQIQTGADVDCAVRLLRLAYLIVDSKTARMCS
jgi:hypothetical protein